MEFTNKFFGIIDCDPTDEILTNDDSLDVVCREFQNHVTSDELLFAGCETN